MAHLGAVPKTNGAKAAENQPIRSDTTPIGSYGCVNEEGNDGLINEQRL